MAPSAEATATFQSLGGHDRETGEWNSQPPEFQSHGHRYPAETLVDPGDTYQATVGKFFGPGKAPAVDCHGGLEFAECWPNEDIRGP